MIRRLACFATLALLLAGCGSGPVRRVSEPAASIQQLTVRADGRWDVALRLNNFSSVAMRFDSTALEIAFEVVNRKDQFPCNYQWQNFHSGQYVIGMEPSTHHVQGRAFARERGEMIWLEHGDERRYDVTFRVFSGKHEIAREVSRIEGIAKQPSDEYPATSGRHLPIEGRR